MRRNIAVVSALAMLLSACASLTETKVWYKPGATQNDFYMDQGQCKAQAFGVAGVTLMQAAVVMNSCLQGKGWYLISQSETPEAKLTPKPQEVRPNLQKCDKMVDEMMRKATGRGCLPVASN